MEVAVAAGGEADGADGIVCGFYVYEFRADKGAGLEGGAAEAECGDTNAFYIMSSSYAQRNTSKRNSYWVVAFRDGKLEE